MLSFRVADPSGGPGGRWHVPRLRASDPGRSSVVTTFAGGACAIRRSAYLEAGGQPGAFFFGHEETDLSWRLMDLGYRLEYDADAVMCHPAVPNARHATWYRVEARNRVWVARRNLPWPLAVLYLADWIVITVLRERGSGGLRAWFGGFADSWQLDTCTRMAICLRTAWRMTSGPPAHHLAEPRLAGPARSVTAQRAAEGARVVADVGARADAAVPLGQARQRRRRCE